MNLSKRELYKICEVELMYKVYYKPSLRPKVSCSDDVYKLFMQLWDQNKINLVEEFKMILLNAANRVIGASNIGVGGISSVTADPKIIFATALKANASAIVLAHNHPSGTLEPSYEDCVLTAKVKEVGTCLGMRMLDHLIVTNDGYYSFSDEKVELSLSTLRPF